MRQSRVRDYCRVSTIVERNCLLAHRSGRDSYWDFCKSLRGAYNRAISSSSTMRVPLSLRLPDTFDSLQIFLQQTGSQEIKFLMVHSTIGPVFNGDGLSRHAVCNLLELPLTVASLSRKSVPPALQWFRHDTLMLVARPPPWPDWCKMWFSSIRSCLLSVTTAFTRDEYF